MKHRPLRWRVLDAVDRVRTGVKFFAAGVVAAVLVAIIPRRRREPGPEQWLADRRSAREHLTEPTNPTNKGESQK